MAAALFLSLLLVAPHTEAIPSILDMAPPLKISELFVNRSPAIQSWDTPVVEANKLWFKLVMPLMPIQWRGTTLELTDTFNFRPTASRTARL